MPNGLFARGRSLALMLAAATAVAACENPFSNEDGTRIRLRNGSPFELTDVSFWPGPSTLTFTRIGPLETTGYTTVPNAYPYGTLDVLVAGEHRRLQVIDFVGESYLDEGEYTFVISVDPATKNPTIRLVED